MNMVINMHMQNENLKEIECRGGKVKNEMEKCLCCKQLNKDPNSQRTLGKTALNTLKNASIKRGEKLHQSKNFSIGAITHNNCYLRYIDQRLSVVGGGAKIAAGQPLEENQENTEISNLEEKTIDHGIGIDMSNDSIVNEEQCEFQNSIANLDNVSEEDNGNAYVNLQSLYAEEDQSEMSCPRLILILMVNVFFVQRVYCQSDDEENIISSGTEDSSSESENDDNSEQAAKKPRRK
ncbi:hypothetical protein FQR65_LT07005 [Abscondita terminalis]|nr:hypothetical protein FQR65_LT07005 [Abscondita terminalis]